MKRREFLFSTGAASLGASLFPFRASAASFQESPKVLYFTRNVGFEHSSVHREGDRLSHSEKVLVDKVNGLFPSTHTP